MKIYTTCYDLPLSRFIRCDVDGDYSALIIESDGPVDGETLKEAWQAIHQEYLDISGAAQDNYLLSLQTEINRLFIKRLCIVETVALSRKYRYDDAIKLLQGYGYRFPFDPNDPEAYHKDLDRVLTRSNTLVVEMEQKQSQLEALKPKGDGAKVTRGYYDQWLVALSKFSGYHINEDVTTVSRFVTILKSYITHCDQLKAQQHAGR